jgi:hypothetical protein
VRPEVPRQQEKKTDQALPSLADAAVNIARAA